MNGVLANRTTNLLLGSILVVLAAILWALVGRGAVAHGGDGAGEQMHVDQGVVYVLRDGRLSVYYLDAKLSNLAGNLGLGPGMQGSSLHLLATERLGRW